MQKQLVALAFKVAALQHHKNKLWMWQSSNLNPNVFGF